MRFPLLLALLVPTLLAAPRAAGAQLMRDTMLTFNTSRTVRIAPDRATWYVTVEGTAESFDDAQARMDGKLTALLSALRALGPTVEVGTPVTVSVGATEVGRGYPGAPTVPPLTVRSAVRVHVSRLADVPRALATGIQAGVAGTSAITYDASNLDDVRQRETEAVIRGLREDAGRAASALGGRVGALVLLTISSNDRTFGQQTLLISGMSMGQPNAAPEVAVTVSVSAHFKLER